VKLPETEASVVCNRTWTASFSFGPNGLASKYLIPSEVMVGSHDDFEQSKSVRRASDSLNPSGTTWSTSSDSMLILFGFSITEVTLNVAGNINEVAFMRLLTESPVGNSVVVGG